jgi:hypothetical protein
MLIKDSYFKPSFAGYTVAMEHRKSMRSRVSRVTVEIRTYRLRCPM